MHVGPQVTAGRDLEGLADVEDQRARHRGGLEPAAVLGTHLQARSVVLEHQREPPVVLVRPDALALLSSVALRPARGVVHQLGRRDGLVVEPAVEPPGILTERLGQQPEHGARDPLGLAQPAQHDGAQLGHRGGPLVGPDEPQVGRVVGAEVDDAALGADVDLLALVGGAGGVLVATLVQPRNCAEFRFEISRRAASGRAKKVRVAASRSSCTSGGMPCPVT